MLYNRPTLNVFTTIKLATLFLNSNYPSINWLAGLRILTLAMVTGLKSSGIVKPWSPGFRPIEIGSEAYDSIISWNRLLHTTESYETLVSTWYSFCKSEPRELGRISDITSSSSSLGANSGGGLANYSAYALISSLSWMVITSFCLLSSLRLSRFYLSDNLHLLRLSDVAISPIYLA